MTEIPLEANVECTDGLCGKSAHLIVNPVSRTVTHFVVEDKHLPDEHTRLVPIEHVIDTTHKLIRLNCTRADVGQMQPFITTRYVPPPQAQLPTNDYWSSLDPFMAPVVVPMSEQPYSTKEEHIPEGEKDIHRGMQVQATDGKIGQVDELIVEPESWRITHVVLRHGHLWGKKEVTLPMSDIDRIAGGMVYLKIDKATVDSRPTIPVKRFFD